MTSRFSDALAFAHSLHRGQRRKVSGCPFIAHPLAVASLVLEAGGSEDEAIAALLHDAVEDQGGPPTAARIRRRFGDRVADIVDACTEDRSRGDDWLSRKREAIRRAAVADASTRLVIAADKLHNLRSLAADRRRVGGRAWEFFHGGREGAVWYHRAMADSLASAGGSPLQAELEREVRALEASAGGFPES